MKTLDSLNVQFLFMKWDFDSQFHASFTSIVGPALKIHTEVVGNCNNIPNLLSVRVAAPQPIHSDS